MCVCVFLHVPPLPLSHSLPPQDEASYEQALARATANMRAIGSINDYVSREHVDAQGALQRLQTAITGELARTEQVADAKRYE